MGEERMTRGVSASHIEADHLARYRWACRFSEGRAVLDVGCGTGYGLSMLMENARSAVGVDKFDQSHPNAVVCDLREFLPQEKFELITCFELIEHIEDAQDLLQRMRGWLVPGGTLLISTPNRQVTAPDGVVNNPFHVDEWTQEQFTAMLEKAGWRIEEFLGQRWQFIPGLKLVRKVYKTLCKPWQNTSPDVQPPVGGGRRPEYMIFVCKPD